MVVGHSRHNIHIHTYTHAHTHTHTDTHTTIDKKVTYKSHTSHTQITHKSHRNSNPEELGILGGVVDGVHSAREASEAGLGTPEQTLPQRVAYEVVKSLMIARGQPPVLRHHPLQKRLVHHLFTPYDTPYDKPYYTPYCTAHDKP